VVLAGALLIGCSAQPKAQTSGPGNAAPSTAASAPAPVASVSTIAPGDLQGTIVFAKAGGQYGDETLFAANADGTNERQLTPNGQSCCLRISPDGTQVLYSTYSIAEVDRRVTTAIQNLADGTIRTIPLPDATANLGAGAWSPDAQRLALQLWDDSDHSRDGIYTVRSTHGSDLMRLTDAEIADAPSDYSPDGTQLIVFRESSTQSVGELFVLDLDGGELKPLSPTGMNVGFGTARYSPDGMTILFQEARTSDTGALWSIRADGSGLTKLFEDAAGRFVSHPTWSPDGSMIMFALNPVADDFRHAPNGIYVIDADGSNLRMVLGGNDFKREPEWRPTP
jgi:Tol biopolymer transport system component